MDRSTTILAFIGGLVAALLIVLIVVLLTGDDGGGDAVDATTSSSETTTTTVATTTTAPATTTAAAASSSSSSSTTAAPATTAPGGRCAGLDGLDLPDGVELVGGPGNFDGAPEPESIMDADFGFVFEDGGDWYVGFSLETGYVTYDLLPEAGPADFEPTAVVWNFDGDDGLLVNTDFSLASGAMVYVFYFLDEDCQVEDAGTLDTDPIDLLDWSGAAHTQAFTCVDDGVFETSAGQTGSGSWDVRNRFYEWTAPAAPGFEFGFEDGMEVPDGDPAITDAGIVDC